MDLSTTMYRVSVKALIRNHQGDLMLWRHPNNLRWIPWWWVEHGEWPREAMKREIQEELWVIPITISEYPVRFYTYHRWPKKKYPWVANIYYDVEIDDTNLLLEDWYEEVRYFNFNELKELDTWIDFSELFDSLV